MPASPPIRSGVLAHDGCRLHFKLCGDGVPVVLIQGVGVHGDAWRPQVEALAPGYRCLWFDNRGVGASQPPSSRLTVEQMAGDALALMQGEGLDSAHIIGHSLGGLVALRLALVARERVRSLSLLCTFARGRDAGASLRMAWLGLRSRVGSRRMRRNAFLQILASPSELAGVDRVRRAAELSSVFGHDLADHSRVEMQQLSAMRGYDANRELSTLAGLPTLIVSAAHDPIAPPRLGDALARGIPGARHVSLEEASHGVLVQSPARVNELLIDHLARADGNESSQSVTRKR